MTSKQELRQASRNLGELLADTPTGDFSDVAEGFAQGYAAGTIDRQPVATLGMVTALDSLMTAAQGSMVENVAVARTLGTTWAAIGDALGITKQAAQQRYGKDAS